MTNDIDIDSTRLLATITMPMTPTDVRRRQRRELYRIDTPCGHLSCHKFDVFNKRTQGHTRVLHCHSSTKNGQHEKITYLSEYTVCTSQGEQSYYTPLVVVASMTSSSCPFFFSSSSQLKRATRGAMGEREREREREREQATVDYPTGVGKGRMHHEGRCGACAKPPHTHTSLTPRRAGAHGSGPL